MTAGIISAFLLEDHDQDSVIVRGGIPDTEVMVAIHVIITINVLVMIVQTGLVRAIEDFAD